MKASPDPPTPPTPEALPGVGARLGGIYRVVREIGRGAMGVVFEVVDERLDRACALKLLRPQAHEDAGSLRRFEREAKILAKLSSPNLVHVLDVGHTDGGWPYLVMELLEGETLEARLAEGTVSVKEALAWTLDLCAGASAAHEAGVVHRDLKPSNVILTKSGAKIVDFGVASFVSGSMEGSTASIAGTPRTMSPEQLLGERVGPESDVFAIGVVAYRMLAGCYPFEAESMAAQMLAIMKGHVPLSDMTHVSKAVSEVVSRALERDPSARIGSAKELARALVAASGETPDPTRAEPPSAASEALAPQASPAPESPSFSAEKPLPPTLHPLDEQASTTPRGLGGANGARLAGLLVLASLGAWAYVASPRADSPSTLRTQPSEPAPVATKTPPSPTPPDASGLFFGDAQAVPPPGRSATSVAPAMSAPAQKRALEPSAPRASTKPPSVANAPSTPATSGDGFPPHL